MKRASAAVVQESRESSHEGVVVVHFGREVEVRLPGGERQRVRLKRGAPTVVVGDQVRVSISRIELLPRRNLLRRRDARGRSHLLAANLDVLAITIAAEPAPPADYTDRAIVAARAAGIPPVLVVNKCDLASSRELATRVRNIYAAAGSTLEISVFALSAVDGRGLGDLSVVLAAGCVGAFVGTSGAGKSSLLNALVPGLALEVGSLNRFTRLGRHVTTRSSLHSLPSGGELIDTPGFRDFVPDALSPRELATHFAGFEAAVESGCRFRDCLHRDEPDCRIGEEVAAGRIDPCRREAYLRILDDLERAEREERVRKRDR